MSAPTRPESADAPTAARLPRAASADHTPRRRRLPLRKKLLFTAIALLVPPALAECALRLFAPQQVTSTLPVEVAQHQSVPWGMVPSREWTMYGPEFGDVLVHTNRDGIVDHVEHAVEKRPGTLRLLMLGDSFAEGWGLPYEQRFATIVERALQSALGADRVEVIKTGIRGFNTADEANVLEIKWAAYRPDVIVLAFVLNDLVLNPPYDPAAPIDELVETAARRRFISSGRFERLTTQVHVCGAVRRLTMASDTLYQTVYFLYRAGNSEPLRVPPPPAAEEKYANSLAHLGRIHAASQRIDAELHIIFIPQRIQVMLARRPIAGIDADLLPTRLGQSLSEWGVPWCDLLPAMSKLPPETTHFTADGHFTATGADVTARELLVHLLTRSTSVRQALPPLGAASTR